MAKEKTQVIQDPNEEVPAAIVALSIKRIADGYQRMKKAGLSERAIVLLLHDASGVGKPAIKDVLYALENLKKLYLRDWKTKP